MGVGKYRHRIIIQRPAAVVDASGGPTQTWVDFWTCWAELQIGSGREYFGAKKANAKLAGLIKIRYVPGLDSTMRVVYNDRTFQILGPPVNVGGRNREIELQVKEVD